MKTKSIEKDLFWYWNNSDADCGNRSSWNACINAACFGNHQVQDPYTPIMLNAIHNRRQIEAILRQIPEYNQLLLYATYGFTAFVECDGFKHSDIEEVMGKLTNQAACILPYDQLGKLCRKYKLGLAKASEKALIKYVRETALRDKEASIMMYVEAKRKMKTTNKRHF
jgi:hypothetical protein